ncbi:hypothetical protein FJ872_33170 [Mesorhizobium sp. B2-5-9]|nr:hypothetical protein FJ872_33170 [Mesorhizobium sp. B2-5-9]
MTGGRARWQPLRDRWGAILCYRECFEVILAKLVRTCYPSRCISRTLSTNVAPFFVAVGASGSDGLSDIKDLLSNLPKDLQAIEGAGHIHRGQTVDILFNSVAVHAKTCAIGIVLSGSLSDGSRGLAAIAHASGATKVLTEAGEIKARMPMKAAMYDGPLDFTGSADQIAGEVIRRVRRAQPQPLLV